MDKSLIGAPSPSGGAIDISMQFNRRCQDVPTHKRRVSDVARCHSHVHTLPRLRRLIEDRPPPRVLPPSQRRLWERKTPQMPT